MIVIFMAQLHPAGDVNIQNKVKTLTYQAINDSGCLISRRNENDYIPVG
jgi:hypothetical protein